MTDRYAEYRRLRDEAVSLIADAHREWWRPLHNRKRRGRALVIMAAAKAERERVEQSQ